METTRLFSERSLQGPFLARETVITKYDRRYTDRRPHQAVETEALKQTTLIRILRSRLNRLPP